MCLTLAIVFTTGHESRAARWKCSTDAVGDLTKYPETRRLRFFVDVINSKGEVDEGLKPEHFAVEFSDDKGENQTLVTKDVEVSSYESKNLGTAILVVFAGHSNYGKDPTDKSNRIFPCGAQKKGIKTLLDGLGKSDDWVALWTYTNDISSKELMAFTRDTSEVAGTVTRSAKCTPISDTGTGKPKIQMFKTILSALDAFDTDGLPKRKIMILMSDGQDLYVENDKLVKRLVEKVRSKAKDKDVRVHTIGFSMTGGKYLLYLKKLSASTQGTYREASKLDEIPDLYAQILGQIKKQYIVDVFPKKFKGKNKDLRFRLVVKPPKGPVCKTQYVPADDLVPIPFNWLRWVIIGVSALLGLIILIVFFRWLARRPKKEKPIVEEQYDEPGVVPDDSPRGPVKGKLEVVAGPLVGRTFWITDDITTIGSMEGNNIVLSDSSVSKRHAGIRVEDKRYELADFGSTNHTFINGRKINKQFLRNGDKIRFGDTEMTFTLQ